jgi:hypothetical protein
MKPTSEKPNAACLTRRQFLRRGLQTAGTIPILTAAAGIGSTLHAAANPELVRLAFIGTGGRGRDLLRGFVGLPGVRVTALCDPFQDRREAARTFAADWKHPDAFASADYREVIGRSDVDAVVIATQDHWLECHGNYRHEGLTDNINDWHATFTYPHGLKLIFTDYLQQKPGCRFIGDKGWVYVDRPTIQAEPASLLEVKLKERDLHLPVSTNHGLDFIEAIRQRRDPGP